LESLEPRLLLTTPGNIVPEQLYQDVAFTDAHGDTVEVSIAGPTPANSGFTISLAGAATDNADIDNINLLGLTAQDGLVIQVTPNPMTITGGGDNFAQIFSSGYVNVASITATADANFPSATAVTDLGGIQLSAAVVSSISLPGVDIGDITLDTGEVTYVDRVNSSTFSSTSLNAPVVSATGNATLEEINDESPVGQLASYSPCTGLIDLNNVQAGSISSLVINGATAESPGNTSDEFNTMNDFEGVITVTGAIGSIIGPNSALKGTIIAGSIGSADLGILTGTLTTTDPSQPLTITLPEEFSGFLNSAGHLNLAFPFQSSGDSDPPTPGATPTAGSSAGQITSGGGISGIDPSSTTDTIRVPDQYAGVVIDTSTTAGIADIAINGTGMSRWVSASGIGDITANGFAPTFIATAAGDIGNIQALTAGVGGHFQAGGDIGNVEAAGNISADLIAGGNIGTITGITDGLAGNIITAGGDIGDISVIQLTAASTHITAGGDLGTIHVYSGEWAARVQAQDIGDITDDSGNLALAVFVATGSIGDISVTAKTGDAISGGSIVAGTSIGTVSAYANEGTAIVGALIQAGDQEGDQIAGVTAISYGATTLPGVSPGPTTSPAATFNGIDSAQILAAQIGPILGQAYVGTGINQAVVHSQVDGIDSITGIGNGDGINATTVVSEAGIGDISGQSTVQGAGIYGGSFDANGTSSATAGTIGQITAQGGPAGGYGIYETRFQASNRIDGIAGTANANGGDAISTISTYATSYGPIVATVLGGQTGGGIVNSTIKAWSDDENDRPDVQIDAIDVDVRSALGMGITGTVVTSKGDLVAISAKALNASAISGSTFSVSSGDFGSIFAESVNGGTAIENSIFTASDGSITLATDLADASTSGIVAIADGSSLTSNAISGSTFTADENIGWISATANGGTAILNSTFTADSSYGSPDNGPNLPGSNLPGDGDLGAIFGITATTSGQNLAASAGIAGSSFEGQLISSITASVTDREEGGPGIIGSTFTARNAVYDNNGNFDNDGTIGAINVIDGSLAGNGIDSSQFIAGAGGSIGNITVTTLGGIGITGSTFSASTFDDDQANFGSTIGNITVTTGRAGGQSVALPAPPNNAWTALPAGISTSYFAANGGLGNINVNSIGTGVFYSAFLGNFASQLGYGLPGLVFPFLAPNVPGDIGNINITSTGRFGAGSVFSAFSGTDIGDIQLQVASRDPNGTPVDLPNIPGPIGAALQFVESLINFTIKDVGPAASAASLFVATGGNLGRINVTNSGPGPDSIASAFVALPAGLYGPVNNVTPAWGNLFWGIPRLFGSGTTPTATVTTITPPTAGNYGADDVLTFTVNFSGSVAVTGQPALEVQVGSRMRSALYSSGSGSSQLLFSLTVDPGDSGAVTIPSGTTIDTDINNRITDNSSGEEVTALTPTVGGPGGVVVDTAAPTVTSVSPIQASSSKRRTARYSVGELLTVIVTFSEAVSVRGIPTLALTIGKYSRSLAYSSGSGTNTLRFTYTLTRADVQAQQSAQTDGQIQLPGGATITDLAGNAAGLPAATSAVTERSVSQGHVAANSRGTTAVGKTHARALPTLANRAIVFKHGLTSARRVNQAARPTRTVSIA
jgi:hypothetical protein